MPVDRPDDVEGLFRSGFLFDHVLVSCRITINGERILASRPVPRDVWADPIAREHVARSLRMELVNAVLERWTPKIHVQE